MASEQLTRLTTTAAAALPSRRHSASGRPSRRGATEYGGRAGAARRRGGGRAREGPPPRRPELADEQARAALEDRLHLGPRLLLAGEERDLVLVADDHVDPGQHRARGPARVLRRRP